MVKGHICERRNRERQRDRSNLGGALAPPTPWRPWTSVAPRLRATGLPCIASPDIMSSGNTQQHGTETTALLILAEYIGLILHRDTKPMGTHSATGQYVHYLMNMAGASITRNYAATEERRSGTPWHRDTDVGTA